MEEVTVSLCLVSYNQEAYIKDSLESVLNQDYENLEIVISDDNSTDNTFFIIKEICEKYNGKHQLIINRNEKNLGLVGNVNKAISLSKGKYIALAAGDDVMNNNRITLSVKEIARLNVGSITFNMDIIDSSSAMINKKLYDGNKVNTLIYNFENYFKKNYISCGASRIIDRQLVDVFGPIDNKCPTEDSVFNLRAFLLGNLAFSPSIVGKYRRHKTSVSSSVNLLTKIDPYLIYKQYEKDINLAFEKQIISEKLYIQYKNDITIYLNRESYLREVFKAKSTFRRFCVWLSFLLSCKIKINNKLSLLLKIIEWRKNGI